MRSRGRCSKRSAIHITTQSWLCSSSSHEPSDPPLKVISFSLARINAPKKAFSYCSLITVYNKNSNSVFVYAVQLQHVSQRRINAMRTHTTNKHNTIRILNLTMGQSFERSKLTLSLIDLLSLAHLFGQAIKQLVKDALN